MMLKQGLQQAWNVLQQAVARKEIPGAAAVIGCRQGILSGYACGHLAPAENPTALAQIDSLYDCASLTKVIVTLPLILQLVDRGLLRLEEPVATYISEFAVRGKASVTVENLLTHSSGLPGYEGLYALGYSPRKIKEYINNLEPTYAPGTEVVYSDLGFIVLGEIVERILNVPLAHAAWENIFQPLGMQESLFCPEVFLRERIAATEYRETLGRHQWGEVHDENAAALGGASGQAGLFSTCLDLARYAQMWLNQGKYGDRQVLSSAIVNRATQCQTTGLGAPRGLGWVLKGGGYGHTGFTGTSLWLDPEKDLFVVLLTNRVYFGRDSTAIVKLRQEFHNTVASSIGYSVNNY